VKFHHNETQWTSEIYSLEQKNPISGKKALQGDEC
jgi:hypothetical protein